VVYIGPLMVDRDMNARHERIPLLACAAAMACAAASSSIDLSRCPPLGNEDAQIEVVVYSDFQCAFCKRAAAEIGRLVRRRPARIKVCFKHFPIARHAQSVNAAKAAEAARLQGRFWEMHDLLFAHAGELTGGVYERLASRLGLDVDRFLEDMASAETAERIAADTAEGRALGVDGTPFFFVNRTPFYGSYADLVKRLDGLHGSW